MFEDQDIDYGAILNSAYDSAGDFLSSPNTQVGLATLGSGIAQGQELGQVLGETAIQQAKMKQLQSGQAKLNRQNSLYRQGIIDALRGPQSQSQPQQQPQQAQPNIMKTNLQALSNGSLVGDPSDNSTYDKAIIDGKGNMTLTASNAVKPYQNLQDAPIENQVQPAAMTTNMPRQVASNAGDFLKEDSTGGIDLRNFS